MSKNTATNVSSTSKPITIKICLDGIKATQKGFKDKTIWANEDEGKEEVVRLECNTEKTLSGSIGITLEGWTEHLNSPAGMKFVEFLAASVSKSL